jgi:hypothetical protein
MAPIRRQQIGAHRLVSHRADGVEVRLHGAPPVLARGGGRRGLVAEDAVEQAPAGEVSRDEPDVVGGTTRIRVPFAPSIDYQEPDGPAPGDGLCRRDQRGEEASRYRTGS